MIRFVPAAVAALLSSPALACTGLEITDAYAIRATPMAPTAAAFMTIRNHGDADCLLLSVRSDVAQRTELHTHVSADDGVIRMVHVTEGFALPAGTTLPFERGGRHVMFLGVSAPLAQDDQIALTLVFADGAEHETVVPVDLTRLGGGHGSGGHGN